MTSKAELAERIRARQWYHAIDLGDGLVTRGQAQPSQLLSRPGVMPEVAGKSVLDIGAWDGKYSFWAEMSGAGRVVALDHYMWRLDSARRQAYYDECEREGRLPDPDLIDHGFLDAEHTPGKEGFDLAHEYLDSKVEAVAEDFMSMDLERLGTFDVVLYLGVLYHMVNPVGALHRLRQVTRGVAVIETETVKLPPYVAQNLAAFYPGRECRGDYTNWFAPSERVLHGMCRAAGFSRVETKAADKFSKVLADAAREWDRSRWREWVPLLAGQWSRRIVVHAYA